MEIEISEIVDKQRNATYEVIEIADKRNATYENLPKGQVDAIDYVITDENKKEYKKPDRVVRYALIFLSFMIVLSMFLSVLLFVSVL